jgi:hypothetical protein
VWEETQLQTELHCKSCRALPEWALSVSTRCWRKNSAESLKTEGRITKDSVKALPGGH